MFDGKISPCSNAQVFFISFLEGNKIEKKASSDYRVRMKYDEKTRLDSKNRARLEKQGSTRKTGLDLKVCYTTRVLLKVLSKFLILICQLFKITYTYL